jgi:N-sulfoglucosamine sulfohydrolase
MTSHGSSIQVPIPAEKLRHNPSKVVLPPYHPDTPEMWHDWAQYYDKVEDLDARAGQLLQKLMKASSLAIYGKARDISKFIGYLKRKHI